MESLSFQRQPTIHSETLSPLNCFFAARDSLPVELYLVRPHHPFLPFPLEVDGEWDLLDLFFLVVFVVCVAVAEDVRVYGRREEEALGGAVAGEAAPPGVHQETPAPVTMALSWLGADSSAGAPVEERGEWRLGTAAETCCCTTGPTVGPAPRGRGRRREAQVIARLLLLLLRIKKVASRRHAIDD